MHQRGYRLGIYNLGLMGGLNLVLPISAVIITDYGWRPVNYGMGGAFVIGALLVLLFMPESTFTRQTSVPLPSNVDGSDLIPVKSSVYEHREKSNTTQEQDVVVEQADPNPSVSSGVISRKVQYKFWTGTTYDSTNLGLIMMRPFQVALSPPVAWSAVMYSSGIAFQVVLGVTVSQIFSAPPYRFTVIQVGLTKLSAFVASLFGAIIARPLSDGLAVRLAKLNNGVYGKDLRGQCYNMPCDFD